MRLGKEMPSLVVSGINHGSNSAINVLYSGTMGAAIEGGFYDIPSIGFSLLDHDEDADFSAALRSGRSPPGAPTTEDREAQRPEGRGRRVRKVRHPRPQPKEEERLRSPKRSACRRKASLRRPPTEFGDRACGT